MNQVMLKRLTEYVVFGAGNALDPAAAFATVAEMSEPKTRNSLKNFGKS